MLNATNIAIGYPGSQPIVENIDFRTSEGELILLLGINGIGKSTLLKTLVGLISPLSGALIIDGSDSMRLTPSDRARKISAVFASKEIDGFITVSELVALGRYPYTGWLGRLSAQDMAAVKASMEKLQIAHLATKKVAEISDGERQKAFIAKTLAQDTPIVILDEPTAFLDYKSKSELLSNIKKICTHEDKNIILSTHDIATALPYADRLFLITEDHSFRAIEPAPNTVDQVIALMKSSASR